MDNIIDAHVHVWTDDVVRYPRVANEADYPPKRFTPGDFLAHARPNGVTRALLVQMSFYGLDHSYMLHSIRTHQGAFSGIGVVSPRSGPPDAAMKTLAAEGVRGFRIVPGNLSPSALDLDAIWACGAAHDLAVCPLINPEQMSLIDRMCARFPETPVVIDHLARIGMDGTVRESDVRQLCSLAKHTNVYVKVSALYALGRKQAPYTDLVPMIRQVYENYGPHRLMWGSDSPFQVVTGHRYADSIGVVREYLDFIPEHDRAWLLSGTAESLFFKQ